MALEIKLVDVYQTPAGRLRAKVSYAGQTHTLKCDYLKSKKQIKTSFVSMPVGLTSFEVTNISQSDLGKSVTLKLYSGRATGPQQSHELVRLDFVTSAFI